jgi:hypothetical protein
MPADATLETLEALEALVRSRCQRPQRWMSQFYSCSRDVMMGPCAVNQRLNAAWKTNPPFCVLLSIL